MGQVFKEKNAFLLRFLRRRLTRKANRQDAEDEAQEIWQKLLQYKVDFSQVQNREAYLVTTAIHAAIKFNERQARDEAAKTSDAAIQRDGLLEDLVRAADMQRAVAQMSEVEQSILKMKYDAGMTTQEIAQTCDLSPDQVERHLTDARDHLKPLLSNVMQGRVRK
jgi:RNA polymerase sigma factor (sigma-70 family)